MFGVEEILGAVRRRATEIRPDEWVVGGIVISPVFHAMENPEMLAALDEASMGRPVMLRDDSLHSRWVNSRALEILGIHASSKDPAGGSYARDTDGRPVGLLLEQPSTDAGLAARRSVDDPHARDLQSARTAVSIFNSVGVTSTQDAATVGAWLDVFTELDRAKELNAWIIGSLPAREFIKAVLDGVPMTRTSKFLDP